MEKQDTPKKKANDDITGFQKRIAELQTHAKQLEEALLKSETRFTETVNSLALGVYETDIRGAITFVNEAITRFLGYTAKDFSAVTDATAFLVPQDRDRARHYLQAVLSGKKERPVAFTVINRDGEKITVEVTAFPVMDNGVCVGTRGLVVDVTARKQTQEAAIKIESKYQAIFHHMKSGVAVYEAVDNGNDFIFTDFNPAAEYISRISRDKVIGKRLLSVFPNMDKFGLLGTLQSVYLSGQPEHLAAAYYKDAHREGWRDNFVYKLPSGEVVAIYEDVTERKRAEITLQENEEKFRAIVEMSTEWIWAIDLNARHIYSNPAIKTILGYAPEEIVGCDCFPLIHEDDRQMVQETLEEKINRKEGWSGLLVRWRHKDGSYRILESNAVPMYDNEKKLIGFQGVDRDITERKRAEEALQNAEKLEAIGVLAGGIAHDFNNLLTGIFGYVELAGIAISRESASEYLREAARTINRARHLTQQLLTFSKGGAPVKTIVSLPSLIKDTANFVLSGSNISVAFSIPDDLWPGNVDQNQFVQVIDNIVLNARQAMPQGGTITIVAENVHAGSPVPLPLHPDNHVCIAIHDQGTGIAPEHLPRIFDPFFTTKRQGTGLGLAMVYSIVKKHSGHIEVESQAPKGSTFRIWIPASLKKHLTEDPEESSVPAGSGRILLMDDQKVILDTTSRLLHSMGYTVVGASDGHEAVRLYKEAKESSVPFDAVILDLTVPGGMGGKDTIRELLTIDPSVRAIASSGYSNDPIMSTPVAFGFMSRLIKPYTVTEMADVLHRVLAGKK